MRPDFWAAELEEVLLRVGHRFSRADLRRRMRDYMRELLGAGGPEERLAACRIRGAQRTSQAAEPA
ncbi:hypothetical protein GCM10009753_16030 [Streptantibioticus ferralitis]